jgi:zinc-binding alcohol dehydrogenase family protein
MMYSLNAFCRDELLPLEWHKHKLELAAPSEHQLLVKLEASALNPVDIKVLNQLKAGQQADVLGWDAVGIVVAKGRMVTEFKAGDRIWYMGQLGISGAQASHQLVDQRLVAKAPANWDVVQSAALPLTALTAWELLTEKLGYLPYASELNSNRPLLLINGSGGVGSVLLQLCRLWNIQVTATAGRAESQAWCLAMGATSVLPHQALAELNAHQFPAIVCAHDTDHYFDEMARLVAPSGGIVALSSAKQPHAIQLLMDKSASFNWEFVFSKTKYQTADMAQQGRVLQQLSLLAEQGAVQSTANTVLAGLTPETMAQAYQLQSSQQLIGKLVIDYRLCSD